ncbi:pyridine nucleotide-disulfide oxidoreductase [Lachnoanaerobaculum sp. MSX33]|uniref:NAD(P)/FAD-dependent oxidoreductase n=1 Tax=Lachnoanaerobaculum sp. MSX33 TaxID=936596 RepID=UPI0003DF9967|nr:FAD-dependent oxidoreductase [Lachnoanaerobaculum sp. MSX33]ETO98422.1 pyridine nucleotide-disulfide oxidoreductase [Lachnoanaerobaculum sp. MSX33]
MLHINSLQLNVHHDENDLKKKLAKTIGCNIDEIEEYEIRKRSIDARKKPEISYSYSIDVSLLNEAKYLKKNKALSIAKPVVYAYEDVEKHEISEENKRPVVVGFGPAGIFAALLLARYGLKPIVIERGGCVEDRALSVNKFWSEGKLDTESNVSFGEGGAGTFSDGKLNTLVKDTFGRNKFVLSTLVEYGAPKEILYDNKPHIGTDLLTGIVRKIREEIKELGGEVRFDTKLINIENIKDNKKKIEVVNKRDCKHEIIECENIILALGHSARDTFKALKEMGVYMEPKSFALGIRVSHSQHLIDVSQFGDKEAKFLSPAPYKLTFKSSFDRGVYSFCMCPGGFIVNASTEDGRIAINGMSYHKRDSGEANSAIIVSVSEEDFDKYSDPKDPLKGVEFQRRLEEETFHMGNGRVPVQRLVDFLEGRESTGFDNTNLKIKGSTTIARVDKLFPKEIYESMKEAFSDFNRKIKGFINEDAYVAAIESRTSSPVRISRDESLQANISGIYPCGEGAGYAGGIMSAAMDGLKVAERIIEKYKE